MKHHKESQEVSLEEFASRQGFTVEPHRRPGIKGKLGAFVGFLGASAFLGALALVPVAATASVAAQTAEPVVQFWKKIPDQLPEVAIAQRNVIYAKDGSVIAQVWDENRAPLKSVNEISPYAIDALVATEDKRFYQTEGIDYIGTARAALKRSGGGSGITQQLVKNLLYYNQLGQEGSKEAAVEATVARKIRELKLALAYDESHTKDEILLAYFNTVAMGSPNIYGIETASQYYFGKPAKDLSLAQAAALVGTVQNPVMHSFDKEDNKLWKSRQKDVLGRMVAEGKITQAQADEAAQEKLTFVRKRSGGSCAESDYTFYCEYVLQEVLNDEKLGETRADREALLDKGGLQIYTTMDPRLMKMLDEYMEKNWGNTNRLVAPTAIVEPGTGAVLAFGANRNPGEGRGNTTINLPLTAAPEGSAYKPFTLAAALNEGYTERMLDFASEGCPLKPGSNYDAPPGGFRNSNSCKLQGGKLDYREATAFSSNTWFVTLEKAIGVEAVKKFSQSVGLTAPDYITSRSLSYTLGSVGNSPVKVAAAYATFANEGVYCPATPLAKITYADGTVPAAPDTYDPNGKGCRAVMSPKDAGTVLKSLEANLGGVKGAFGKDSFIKGYDTGGKSGTNENLNSAWAHLSGRHSLYTNVYDMDKTTRGVEGAVFKGRSTDKNAAQLTATDLMRSVLKGTKNIPLRYNHPDDTYAPPPPDYSDFITIPSVAGMKPEEAKGVYEGMGMKVEVLKTTEPAPAGYPSGVVVKQSIPAGERLAKGTQKVQELTLTE